MYTVDDDEGECSVPSRRFAPGTKAAGWAADVYGVYYMLLFMAMTTVAAALQKVILLWRPRTKGSLLTFML